MKKSLLLALAVLTSASMFADGLSVPYTNALSTSDECAVFTIIDANNDGSKFSYESSYYGFDYKYSSSNVADDWAISPAIHLEAGKNYSFAIDAKASSANYPEKFSVWAGTSATAADMTTQIMAETTVSNSSFSTFETLSFSVPADGDYYIGIHCTSNANMNRLCLQNFKVSTALSANAPGDAQNVSVTAADNGALGATVSFTMPTTNYDGSVTLDASTVLTAIISGGTEDKTVTGTPGQACTAEVAVASSGSKTFSVTIKNGDDASKNAVSATAYIGVDTPNYPTMNAIQKQSDRLTLSWTPAAKGANGGYVDNATLTYNIYSYASYKYTLVATVENGATTYDIMMDTNAGEERTLTYVVTAKNTTESTKYNSAQKKSVTVGTPVLETIPFTENFADGKTTYTWTEKRSNIGQSGVSSSDSSDKDGYCFEIVGTDYAWGSLYDQITSPKINTKDATNLQLTYDIKSSHYVKDVLFSTVKVTLVDNEGTNTVVESAADITTDWKKHTVDLSAACGKEWSQIIFYIAIEEDESVYLDNIKITSSTPTSINNVNTTNVATKNGKFIENGRIVIINNGRKYNAAGAMVK